MAHRQLSVEERRRITTALTGIEAKTAVDEHLQGLIGFVEGDRSLCLALVKQTPVIQCIQTVMQSNPSRLVESKAIQLSCMLLEGSLSHRAAEPFLKPDRLPVFLPALKHLESVHTMSRVLIAIFAGPDGDTLRDTCWRLGVPAIVMSELLRFYAEPRADGHDAAALCIVPLANVMMDLCGAVEQRQDALTPAVLQLLPVLHFELMRAVSGSEAAAAAAEAVALCISAMISQHARNAAIIASGDNASVMRLVVQNGKEFIQTGMAFQGAALILVFTASASLGDDSEVGVCFQMIERECFTDDDFGGIGRLVGSLPRVLATIRKEHYRSDSVAHSLRSILSFIESAPPAQLVAYRYFLSNCYGALRILHATLSNIDIVVAVRSCKILCFALDCNPPAIRRFVFDGAIPLIMQLLDDYSDDVLTSSLHLLTIMSQDESALREIETSGIVPRILHLLSAAGSRIEAQEDITAPFLGTFRSLLRFLQTAPSNHHKDPSIRIVAGLVEVCVASSIAAVQSCVVHLIDALAAVCRAGDQSVAKKVAPVALRLCNSHMLALLQNPSNECAASIVVSVLRLAVCILGEWGSEIVSLFADSVKFVSCLAEVLSESRIASAHVVHAHMWWVIEKISAENESQQARFLNPFQELAASRAVALLYELRNSIEGSPGAVTQIADELHRCLRCLHNAIIMSGDPSQPLVRQFREDQQNSTAAQLLCIIPTMISSSEIPLAIRDAAVHLSTKMTDLFPTLRSALTPHYARAVLLCESSEDEEDTMLANKSYKALMSIGDVSVAQLIQIGLDALSIARGIRSGAATPLLPWRWAPLDSISDIDDAHDTAVLVVPLLNGMLHQDAKCCAHCLSSGAAKLFVEVLDPLFGFEPALRLSSLDALTNLFSPSATNITNVSACAEITVKQTPFFSHLEVLLADAAACDEPTMIELKASIYSAVQKVLLLVRDITSELERMQRLLQCICLDASTVSSACELVLLILQDEERATMLQRVPFPTGFGDDAAGRCDSLLAWCLSRMALSSKRAVRMQSEQYLAVMSVKGRKAK